MQTFAGFTYPRYIGHVTDKSLSARLKERRNTTRALTSGYYQNEPAPVVAGHTGRSFYHESDFAPGLRWQYCDEIARSIEHSGWYCDAYQHQTIRGIVFRLPSNRGFLIGWTMGEGMASVVDYTSTYEDELSAALAADDLAAEQAEKERYHHDDTEESDE